MATSGELKPARDFLIAAGITALAAIAIFSVPGPKFPVLHTILNTGIAVATGVVALLFWDLGWRTRETLVRYMAIVYAVAGVLDVLHVMAALEPSTGVQWVDTLHQSLRSGTWGPPAYLLPLGIGSILLTIPSRYMAKTPFALIVLVAAGGLFALFQGLPRYADTGFFGITRPALVMVPLLWIPLGLFFWRRRRGHPISHALAYYALGNALSHTLMLWSTEATSNFAMTAHFGVFAAGLYLLLSLMQMGTLNTERRRRVERELLANKVDLETRVAARTAELESLNADLRREIGVRHQAEHRALTQLERLDLLRRITHAIAERHDLASIFQVVVNSIEEHLPVDFAVLCRYERDAAVLSVSRVGIRSNLPARALAMSEDGRIDIDTNGLSRCVAGHLVYEPDSATVDAPFPRRMGGAGFRSLVLVPLSEEPDGVFAVLVLARRAAGAFSSGECEFLRQLCDHVALAASHAQLHDSLQEAYDDLQRTQAAVLEHERLRALGQMASGIAHDINNAISPASVYLDTILEKETGFRERTREQLEIVRRAVDDVARTVARMGEFYRKKPAQLELAPVPVERILREVLDLTRARWSNMAQQRGAVIDTRIETAGVPPVMAIENELREALINLVLNAIDAMPEGGTLSLRAGLTPEGDALPGRVFIEVADSGAGMDDDTRRRCLEPFFTTKGERGSGLGLAMVYGIAQRHDIKIDITSAPGAGTTFRLTFPKQEPARSAPIIVQPRTLAPTRILIVDDDPVLLASLSDVLSMDGHEVDTAAGGKEGIDVFQAAQQAGRPYPVVLTDLGMPHVDGRAVAAAIARLSPTTPVIMLTGWGQRLAATGDIPPHVVAVLSKPPNLAELRRKLAECLES